MSDAVLRDAKRQAQLNPADAASLWKYIQLLERSQAGIIETRLYAILTDGETMGSPCRYSDGTPIPYNEVSQRLLSMCGSPKGYLTQKWASLKQELPNFDSLIQKLCGLGTKSMLKMH